MNNADQVDKLIAEWLRPAHGYTKAQLTAKIAAACLGWPYVYGARGQECTVTYRRGRSKAVPGADGEVIAKKCQVLNGSRSDCKGCKWYPGEKRVRCYDCRGFTWWVLKQVGISIEGGGATSQWKNSNNWAEKGKIEDMPRDKCCVLFWHKKGADDPNKMGHTGLYVGGSHQIIHCSGEVKTDTLATKGWTHYAIPWGMYEDQPVTRPTIRKGSSGAYVRELQEDLMRLGYDLGSYGADGKFGKKTDAAVRAFQRKNGLKVDGIVGKNTWAAILQATEKTEEKEGGA